MHPEDLKSLVAQTFLHSLGFYRAELDGDWGPKSKKAADEWISEHRHTVAPMVHPSDAKVIADGKASFGFLRTLAAQIHLKNLGAYRGEIDGNWGPASRSAALAWLVVNNHSNQHSEPSGNLTPYEVAKQYLGVKEIPGKKHNPVILNWLRRLQVSIFDDETPWCSTFVNFCALESGYERTGKLNARSWLQIGEKVTTQDAQEGDVVIFERGSTGWEGHVAFLVSHSPKNRTMLCLGGNQRDEVNRSLYPTPKLLGIRRLRSLEKLQGSSNRI